MRQESPAPSYTPIFVSFPESQAALERAFDPGQIGNVFCRVTSDQVHVEQATSQVKIRKLVNAARSLFDDREGGLKSFEFSERVEVIDDHVGRERFVQAQDRERLFQAMASFLRLI